MLPLKTIEQVEKIETPLSVDMINALDEWYKAYCNQASWVNDDTVKSMNLPAMIASEIARQVTLEMQWNITGKTPEKGPDDEETPEAVDNPRSEYLRAEFEKLMAELRKKLEQGCAAGGMAVRPYPNTEDGHIYFGWTMDWSLYPVAFDENGDLKDVIFRDVYQDGDISYTRLERHTVEGKDVHVTQRVFKSKFKDQVGQEVPLSAVDQWKNLQPEATLHGTDGQMFGWFKVAAANNVDVDSPMGISVFHKALKVIKQADMQYSRLLWEFEGSELAIDVDPLALRPQKPDAKSGYGEVKYELPKLNERLFRGVNLDEDHYSVFSPAIRDSALLNGLNRLLMMIEDLSGLSRGTLSDAPLEARTATELRILRQRTYATIADNQAALERCLRDVVRAMDKYATIYGLAPEGEYEVSFEWDDSILTDRAQEMSERLELMSQGIISRAEMRQWYTGETEPQAKAAIKAIQDGVLEQNMEAMMQQMQVQSAQMAQTDLDNQASNPVPPPDNGGGDEE
jgi:A118 family predicted phage portal protein